MSNQIYIDWINQTLALPPGDAIYLPCSSKEEQTRLLHRFKDILMGVSEISPTTAVKLAVTRKFRDRKHWIVLEHRADTLLTGFVKNAEGKVSKIELESDREKYRRLKLMAEDGISLERVEELEGQLSDEELLFFNRCRED